MTNTLLCSRKDTKSSLKNSKKWYKVQETLTKLEDLILKVCFTKCLVGLGVEKRTNKKIDEELIKLHSRTLL